MLPDGLCGEFETEQCPITDFDLKLQGYTISKSKLLFVFV